MGGWIEATASVVSVCVAGSVLVRRTVIDAALEGLAAYEFGPGHSHGLQEYWRKRSESERAGRGAINSR
jgi:hypothetical protein